MEDLKAMLKTKFEKSIGGGSLLGIILKTYENQDNPVMVKMRDDGFSHRPSTSGGNRYGR